MTGTICPFFISLNSAFSIFRFKTAFFTFVSLNTNFSNTNGQLILESQMTMTSYKQVRKERKSGNILFLSIYRDFSKGTFSVSSPRSSRKDIALGEENKVKKPHFQRCLAGLVSIGCNS